MSQVLAEQLLKKCVRGQPLTTADKQAVGRALLLFDSGSGGRVLFAERTGDAALARTLGLEPMPSPYAMRPTLDDCFLYLDVVRRAGLWEYRELVERFLDVQEPSTVGLALDILCGDWELTRELLPRLLYLSFRAAWDGDGDVQDKAIFFLVQHLRASVSRAGAEAVTWVDIYQILEHLAGLVEESEIRCETRDAIVRLFDSAAEALGLPGGNESGVVSAVLRAVGAGPSTGGAPVVHLTERSALSETTDP